MPAESGQPSPQPREAQTPNEKRLDTLTIQRLNAEMKTRVTKMGQQLEQARVAMLTREMMGFQAHLNALPGKGLTVDPLQRVAVPSDYRQRCVDHANRVLRAVAPGFQVVEGQPMPQMLYNGQPLVDTNGMIYQLPPVPQTQEPPLAPAVPAAKAPPKPMTAQEAFKTIADQQRLLPNSAAAPRPEPKTQPAPAPAPAPAAKTPTVPQKVPAAAKAPAPAAAPPAPQAPQTEQQKENAEYNAALKEANALLKDVRTVRSKTESKAFRSGISTEGYRRAVAALETLLRAPAKAMDIRAAIDEVNKAYASIQGQAGVSVQKNVLPKIEPSAPVKVPQEKTKEDKEVLRADALKKLKETELLVPKIEEFALKNSVNLRGYRVAVEALRYALDYNRPAADIRKAMENVDKAHRDALQRIATWEEGQLAKLRTGEPPSTARTVEEAQKERAAQRREMDGLNAAQGKGQEKLREANTTLSEQVDAAKKRFSDLKTDAFFTAVRQLKGVLESPVSRTKTAEIYDAMLTVNNAFKEVMNARDSLESTKREREQQEKKKLAADQEKAQLEKIESDMRADIQNKIDSAKRALDKEYPGHGLKIASVPFKSYPGKDLQYASIVLEKEDGSWKNEIPLSWKSPDAKASMYDGGVLLGELTAARIEEIAVRMVPSDIQTKAREERLKKEVTEELVSIQRDLQAELSKQFGDGISVNVRKTTDTEFFMWAGRGAARSEDVRFRFNNWENKGGKNRAAYQLLRSDGQLDGTATLQSDLAKVVKKMGEEIKEKEQEQDKKTAEQNEKNDLVNRAPALVQKMEALEKTIAEKGLEKHCSNLLPYFRQLLKTNKEFSAASKLFDLRYAVPEGEKIFARMAEEVDAIQEREPYPLETSKACAKTVAEQLRQQFTEKNLGVTCSVDGPTIRIKSPANTHEYSFTIKSFQKSAADPRFRIEGEYSRGSAGMPEEITAFIAGNSQLAYIKEKREKESEELLQPMFTELQSKFRLLQSWPGAPTFSLALSKNVVTLSVKDPSGVARDTSVRLDFPFNGKSPDALQIVQGQNPRALSWAGKDTAALAQLLKEESGLAQLEAKREQEVKSMSPELRTFLDKYGLLENYKAGVILGDVKLDRTVGEIPRGITEIRGNLLADGSDIRTLPSDLRLVTGYLDLSDCTSLQELPMASLTVGDALVLDNAANLTTLPANLTAGTLSLTNCGSIKNLPKRLITRQILPDCPPDLYKKLQEIKAKSTK